MIREPIKSDYYDDSIDMCSFGAVNYANAK